MKKATKKTRYLSLTFGVLGVVFLILGAVVFVHQEALIDFFPRHDTAHIGLFILGGTYFIIAGALAMLSVSKSAMTEEGDERMVNISGLAGKLAYVIQTCVLFSVGIFMTFAGYIDAFGLFAIDTALVTGILSYLLITWYCRRKL